jgi:hypothetical protein
MRAGGDPHVAPATGAAERRGNAYAADDAHGGHVSAAEHWVRARCARRPLLAPLILQAVVRFLPSALVKRSPHWGLWGM